LSVSLKQGNTLECADFMGNKTVINQLPDPVCGALADPSSSGCPWKETCPTLNAKSSLSGTEATSPQLLDGWHQDDAGRSLWSMQHARMVVRNPGPKALLFVSGILPPSTKLALNTLRIDCDGLQVGSVCNYSNKHLSFVFKKLIPSSSNDLLHLKFSLSDPYCPSENEISTDRRCLGFGLFHVIATQARMGIKAGLADAVMHLKTVLIEWSAEILSDWIKATHSPAQIMTPDYSATGVSALSIVVIDIQTKGMLESCLSSLEASIAGVEEPIEILVVSDTSPESTFRSLPSIISRRWVKVKSNATRLQTFRAGVASSNHPWVYVVRSQYTLDDLTLLELLKWRAPRVFAVGSASASGNSYMSVRLKHGLVKPEFREPHTKTFAQGAFGVRQDASLYNRLLLLRVMSKRIVYSLTDWTNLEWSIRSWKMGYETIFCPASRLHESFEEPAQSPDYTEQDSLRFLLRNTFSQCTDLRSLIAKILHAGPKAWASLLNPIALASYRASRSMEQASQYDGLPLDPGNRAYYINPHQNKPCLIFVSPYVLFPPSHGSAVGMTNLLRALVQRFSVHILSDESEAYINESLPYFSSFATVRLLSGRREDPEKLHNRIARIESHSRFEMKQMLRMINSIYRPSYVEIEHIELAKLIEAREDSSQPWILNLHDVFLSEDAPGSSTEDRYELDLINRFDSLICCSSEDAALLGKSNVTIVPNAVDIANSSYEPSPAVPRILFIGPSRSPQNIPGIEDFLDHVYPLLLPHFKDLELWILGGKGMQELIGSMPGFKQRGVRVFEYVDDVQEILMRCAITINPISGNRGSCRKVVESLSAGRICVSTREGARGYLELGLPSLLTYEKTQEFTEPIHKLLEDIEYRRNLERLSDAQRYKLGWDYSQQKFLALYASLEE
jgi:hypothetical protein